MMGKSLSFINLEYELAGLAARVRAGAATPADLIKLMDELVVKAEYYNKDLLEACLSTVQTEGLLSAPGFLERISEGSSWLKSPLGIWIVARLLELTARDDRAITAWAQVIDRHIGPVHEALYSRSRIYVQQGHHQAALEDLARAIDGQSDYAFLSRAAALFSRIACPSTSASVRKIRLALLSSTTTNLIAPLLRLACFREHIDAELYVGAFDGFRQEILNPASTLYEFSPDIVIIALNWRDAHLPVFSDDPETQVTRVAGEYRHLWETLLARRPCRIILQNLDIPAVDSYGHLGATLRGGLTQMLREINRRLFEEVPPSVSVLDLERVSAVFGKRLWHDARYWHSMRQYPSSEALPELVNRQVALVRAALGLTKKVLVVDLDNTLWGGVIGEDGLGGIALGPPSSRGEAFQAFQRHILELKERGILLVVCSKNNLEDAQLPFLRHDAMVLHLDDFAIFRANWLDKPTNLREIAHKLNLGLDSFVFLDDNPIERALVKNELPEIAVPELGEDPATFIEDLERGLYFESLTLSQEDRGRHQSYKQNVLREELRSVSGSIEDFLRGLNMEASTGPFSEDVLSRVVQLIGKTNQFNLTSRRHSEETVRRIMGSDEYWTQYFRLRDRFGDNGLIGLMIAHELSDQPGTWEIDTWLMSCRVIGRGMEHFMLEALIEAARAERAKRLKGIYVPTQKNAMVSGLYSQLGFRKLGDSAKEETFILDVESYQTPTDGFIARSRDHLDSRF
jgi:FkbH-like protein